MPGTDFNKLFTDIIQKQITILGPDVTLATVRQIPGILVDDKGVVTQLDGDPHKLLERLIQEFVSISSDIVRETIEPILADYPAVQSTLTSQQATPSAPSMQEPAPTLPQSAPTLDQPMQSSSQGPSTESGLSPLSPLQSPQNSTPPQAQTPAPASTPNETSDPQLQEINQMFNQAPTSQSQTSMTPPASQTQEPVASTPSPQDPTKPQ